MVKHHNLPRPPAGFDPAAGAVQAAAGTGAEFQDRQQPSLDGQWARR